jgi:membrane protein DedA with SNARE-associated domain
MEYFGSFVAGLFFTSIFTTAPAIVTLGQIAEANNIWATALFGAFGALIGDLLIFRFVRDELTDHLLEAMKHSPGLRRLRALMRGRHFRWFTIALGGLIIASPLPDELGISLIGLSKSSTKYFIPMSLVFNFIGILIIGLAARAISV